MGTNYNRLKRWLYKPTWFDFWELSILWTFIYGLSLWGIIMETKNMWIMLLLIALASAFFALIIYSLYRHVKDYNNKPN